MDKKRKPRKSAPEDRKAQSGSQRKAYRKPAIDSSEVFESFTLQSCDAVPEECGAPFE